MFIASLKLSSGFDIRLITKTMREMRRQMLLFNNIEHWRIHDGDGYCDASGPEAEVWCLDVTNDLLFDITRLTLYNSKESRT